MKARVFYFTGTGNSLVAAKKIAERIGGCIDPIVSYKEQKTISIKEDVIGIVFPVYLAQIYGIPEIVRHFLEKLEYDKNKYYFVVCTYGGYAYPNAFPTINNCIKTAKAYGGIINGRFYVRFPMNNLDYDHIPIPIERDTSIILDKAYKKIIVIADAILKQKKGNIFSQTLFNYTLGRLFFIAEKPILKSMRKFAREKDDTELTYHQLVHLSDRSIRFNRDLCNGCGICEKVCPANNIQMKNKTPIWKHNCEMCFACDEWCPHKAIHHWGKLQGKDYHNPSVRLQDIMQQKSLIR
ncbi:MAG: EFR1 family ferrodoxin [Vallitaleaceae bacterium]|nr:EFR1 family ferrodoxin [Vallitaleaceae bacterium]